MKGAFGLHVMRGMLVGKAGRAHNAPMTWIRIAAVLGFLGVSLGAFAAHGLKNHLEQIGYAAQFETGVRYHMFHVVGIITAGLLLHLGRQDSAIRWAPWCFLLGIALFSGSLYVMSLTGHRWLGAITPIGGVFLLAGWACLAYGAAATT